METKHDDKDTMQMRGCVQHPSGEVSEPASSAGDLLDMRQDNHAPLCTSTETDNSLAAWMQQELAFRLQERQQAAQTELALEDLAARLQAHLKAQKGNK